MVIWQDAAQNRVYYYHKWAYYLKCLFLLILSIYLLWRIFFQISRFGLEKKINLTKNTKNCIIFRMPFGSEFHLPRLRQSLYLPSGIGMAFSRTPFGSEFHLSRLGQSLYLPSGIGMAFSSNLIAASTSSRVYEVLSAPRCLPNQLFWIRDCRSARHCLCALPFFCRMGALKNKKTNLQSKSQIRPK